MFSDYLLVCKFIRISDFYFGGCTLSLSTRIEFGFCKS